MSQNPHLVRPFAPRKEVRPTPDTAVPIDTTLVRRLLTAQVPQWADLPVTPVESAGTDNVIFRLGADMAVRLPRLQRSVAQVDKEHRWLPRLAPRLPLAIPVPLARGIPAEGYPWPWSVYRWLEGEPATAAPIADLGQAATDLAGFIAALQGSDPDGGPPVGPETGQRGLPLAVKDDQTRAAIAALRGALDTDVLTAAWETALRAPGWDGPPIWFHGDIHAANLLVHRGRISAVIDFGLLGVGDPACELTVAWSLLSADSRALFRATLGVDDATWARGRGWALAWGLIAYAYYQNSNRVLAGIARHAIDEVIAEQG